MHTDTACATPIARTGQWTFYAPLIQQTRKRWEYGPGTIYGGFPSCLGFGVEGQSYSNFLASTVYPYSGPGMELPKVK